MLNDRVETIYKRLAPVYDLIYGATLDPGRRQAMTRLAPASGELILEVGVGTGLSAVEYPNRLPGGRHRPVARDARARTSQACRAAGSDT